MDRQPPLWIIGAVLVFLSGLEGVFDCCLRPDLTRPDVDAASRREWVAFKDASQLLEVDGQGPQHRRRAAAEHSIKLVGQLIIPVPASQAERNHEIARRLGGSVHALPERSDKTVAGQLERVIAAADAAEQVHDSPGDYGRSCSTDPEKLNCLGKRRLCGALARATVSLDERIR